LSGKTTPAYMAPEMISEKRSTTKVDMWALGVIIYNTMNLIRETEPTPLPSTVSPFIKEIIAKLLDKNPETRLDA
jgi:serine/threonine protein kinase